MAGSKDISATVPTIKNIHLSQKNSRIVFKDRCYNRASGRSKAVDEAVSAFGSQGEVLVA